MEIKLELVLLHLWIQPDCGLEDLALHMLEPRDVTSFQVADRPDIAALDERQQM